MAKLLRELPGRVFVCGLDPRPLRSEIEAGLEAGRLVLSGAMHRRLGLPIEAYGKLPAYRCNPVRFFDDTGFADEWQREVYDLAKDLAVANGWRRIVDIGCGSGFKLVHWFPSSEFRTVGADLPETTNTLRERYPDRDWVTLDIERGHAHGPNLLADGRGGSLPPAEDRPEARRS